MEIAQQGMLSETKTPALNISVLLRQYVQLTTRVCVNNLKVYSLKGRNAMQTHLRVNLAMLAAIGIGVATLASVHAQAPTGAQPPTGAKAPTAPIGAKTPTAPTDSDNSSTNAPKPETELQAQPKTFSWSRAATSGDCLEQAGSSITLRPDGTATWRSQVSSTSSDDAFCHNVRLIDRNSTVLWSWGRFCSFTLSSTPHTWTANLAYPEVHFPFVVSAQKDNHC